MEQRRLRPGDRLDDYCSRERRVTDHVVVAVVDDEIKQTRCVACDTEHAYKDARVPPRRKKKDSVPVLVEQVLEGINGTEEPPPPDTADDPDPQPNLVVRPDRKPVRARRSAPAVPPAEPVVAALPAPAPPPPVPEPVPVPPSMLASDDEAPREPGGEDEGPVHRRLIRATLPRPEGQVPTRPLPEFTIRQPGSRAPHRGSPGNRFGGKVAGPHQGSGWNNKFNGHGRNGASAHGQGADSRGSQRPPRSRGQRPPQKKGR